MEVPVYFEDLVLGASFMSGEVTVDNEEMLAYNRRNDPWPFHVDEASSAQNPYGSLIASGGYTITLMYRLGHQIYNVPGRRWAVLGAMRKRAVPKNAFSHSERKRTGGTPETNARNCGGFTMAASRKAKASASFRSQIGQSSTSGNTL